jgi:hypothetical protein
MTERETFESLLKNHVDSGLTIFDLSELDFDSVEVRLLEFHRSRFGEVVTIAKSLAKETFPQIFFDYYDLDQVNGFAHVDDSGKGYVGVTVEAIFATYDFFYRMLSHPQILSHIGNPTREIIHPHHSQGPFPTRAKRLSERESEFTTLLGVRPIDADRASYAELLGLIAIDFLMHHEVGHILLGHCQYPEVTKNRPLIFESASSISLTTDPIRLINQAIEMDADSYAFAQMSHKHVMHVDSSRWDTRGLQERRANLLQPPYVVLSPFEAVLSDFLLAYNIFCWMMGFDIDVESLLEDDHPPSISRFFTCTVFPKIISPPPPILGIDLNRTFQVAVEAAIYRGCPFYSWRSCRRSRCRDNGKRIY